MDKIQVLENNLINKIAAGEVVERPGSVVKELIENAIDAGATNIVIEIKEGGISLIRITDNGCGIPKEELKTAFLRHATSKIGNQEDLENVLTLGFRGEALSSIAAVSQVEMITKTANDVSGSRIEINGGTVVGQSEIGCVDGTTIIMRNLFFNTPARRKFLKKPQAESGFISDIINKLALGHPEISFKYINNSTQMLATKGNDDLKTAIFQIYGKETSQKLIGLDYKLGDFSLSGYIGKPEINRGNRTYENLFINGRYIKSEIVQAAVEQAYKTKLPIGKFPLFVLNLNVKPSFVDVNVHPTKLEVRFSDEDAIFNAIAEAVDKTLKSENLIPTEKWEASKKETAKQEPPKFSVLTNTPAYVLEEKQHSLKEVLKENIIDNQAPALKANVFTVKEDCPSLPEPRRSISEIVYDKKDETELVESPEEKLQIKKEEKSFFSNYKIIGQIFATYWLIEEGSSMYLIDQHAAHERVLFEELSNKLRVENIHSQQLITPIVIKLSEAENYVVRENYELFERFGFEIQEFGENTYALRSVPYIFKTVASSDFFIEIVDKLRSIDTKVDNLYDTKIQTIATISCKAAVKANDKLGYIEAKTLIEKIVKLENPFTCPHGRPTIIEMTKYELEKKFKRI